MEFIETANFQKTAAEFLSDEDILRLQVDLTERPDLGALIQGGRGLRKIRLAARGKGRRGGARVVYYWLTAEAKIWFLSLYLKSERETLTKAELSALVGEMEEIKDEKSRF